MHCCFGSWMASYCVGTTDSSHLYLSINFSESDWKKNFQRTNQTQNKQNPPLSNFMRQYRKEGLIWSYWLFLLLPLLLCMSTEEVHQHWRLTGTGHSIPWLTQPWVQQYFSFHILMMPGCNWHWKKRVQKVSYLVFRICLKYIIRNQN